MSIQLEVIAEDFTRELQTIGGLLMRASTPREEEAPPDFSVRLAALNASMLLLAASFEEFVRQLTKEFCATLVRSATEFADLPEEIATAAWERCLQILRGLRYGKHDFNHVAAVASIEVLHEFCLRREIGADVSDLVGYNLNNMRIRQINEIFRRVGISDICLYVARREPIIQFFGAPSGDIAHGDFGP